MSTLSTIVDVRLRRGEAKGEVVVTIAHGMPSSACPDPHAV
jgi:hypothetical protein